MFLEDGIEKLIYGNLLMINILELWKFFLLG
jgi:hypothetical protein